MEWKWSKANEKSLAHFVSKDAAKLLKLPESQAPDNLVQTREGRRKLVELIYQALINKNINYTGAKYHPESAIQIIRTPHDVLSRARAGTCLDLALLFCGICLGYDLLPLLIVIEGHAFTAVSLNHQHCQWHGHEERSYFNKPELFAGEKNLEKLQKLINKNAYIAIECTGFARNDSFTGYQPEELERTEEGFLTFNRAVQAGKEQLSNLERPFLFAIDIAVAHYSWHIEPYSISIPEESIINLSPQEREERKRFLNEVKNAWIIDVLKKRLADYPRIRLELEERPNAVNTPASRLEEFDEFDRKLPPETKISNLFYGMGVGRSLLILGGKGAGKTIELLELTKNLIAGAQEDLSQLIPVFFNLSSWASERLSIDKWLIKELKFLYKLNYDISQKWLQNKQMILLLDGLDEVNQDYRIDCISALNKFIQDYGGTEMVVCCRIEEYPTSQVLLLQLQKAIYIKYLEEEKIYQYLEKSGERLAALNTLLHQDREFLKLAKSPLVLNIMSRAYEGSSRLDITWSGSEEQQLHKLFNAYLKKMFSVRKTSHRYPKQETMKWLIWLAKRMNKAQISIFLIEKIHPSWLSNYCQKLTYSLGVGLIYGLAYGLSLGLSAAWSYGLIAGLAVGVIFGFAFGVSAWLIVGVRIEQIVERVVNSLAKAIDRLMGRESPKNNPDIVTTTIPNQEIKEEVKNALLWGAVSAFLSAILTQILQPKLFLIGIFFGFTFGATTQGRGAIQHFILRVILYFSNKIPCNYADFLNYADERCFLQKVGGGYIFIHPLLQEHFAEIDDNSN